MGKTTTTVDTRTYQRDGKWFEETVETTVVESKDGTRTSTKTTTKQLPGPPGTATTTKPGVGARRSSSETDTPPVSPTKEEGNGLLARLRAKTSSKGSPSSSDEEKEQLKNFTETDRTFQRDVKDAINGYRRKHGVPDLKLNDKLTVAAMKWAVHCASKDKMQHKQDQSLGENIYRLTANMPVEKTVASGEKIVNHWYSEVEKHKFGSEPKGARLETGHFTQMVWKSTTDLGVGIAISDSKRNIYIVTFFSPKGNWMGEFMENVPPVGGFTTLKSPTRSVTPASARGSPGGKFSARGKGATSPSSSSSDENDQDFNGAVLQAHNDYRRKHGVPPMELSSKLNKVAEDWARIIAKKDRMEHRPNNQYGENIYAKWSSKSTHTIPGSEAVESWYSEIKDHVFGREPRSLASGHFTQVIWRDSKYLGVGIARSTRSGKLYVVCNYDPAGNMMGEFSTKVPPPK